MTTVDVKMSRRIITINLIMSCCIAIYHFRNAVTVPDPINEMITNYITLAAKLAMNWFFFLTGMLLFRGFSLSTFPTKIKRRFFNVLLPYLFWQLAFGLKGLLNGELGNFLQTVFLLKKYPPDGPLWYMYAVFYLALISPLFYALLKNKKAGLIVVVFLTLFLHWSLHEYHNPATILLYGHLPNVFSYLPSYAAGLYLGLHGDDTVSSILPLVTGLLGSAFLFNTVWDGILALTAPRLLCILLLYLFPVPRWEPFFRYANISFFVYALHKVFNNKPTVAFVRSHVLPYTDRTWLVNLLCCMILLCFTLLLSAVLWLVLSLLSPALLRFITGGRVKPLPVRKKLHIPANNI